MNFLAPAALAFSALSIPIILLYMLRLRRVDTMISSNFLWQQLLRDREANAPWQRLRPSWLLFLQLLILAALVLALARPYMEVKTISSGRIVLLLDASASMNATDVEDSRFEQAQQLALDMVDTLGGDDSMTVIRVADVPQVLVAAERDRTALRRAINSADPSDTSADWVAALTIAAAGAKGVEDLDVVVISDGGLPADLPTIPGEPRLVIVGEAAENVAISALSTRSIASDSPQLFAQLTNYGTEEAKVVFSLNLDGELFNAQVYTIPGGQRADVIVNDLPPSFRELEASLSPSASATVEDYLSSDDSAFAVYNASAINRVLLVTERNLFLQQVFESFPGIEVVQADPAGGIPRSAFDLYIFDGWIPDSLPAGDVLIVNPPQSSELFTVDGVIEDINQSAVTAILPDDPRTQYVDFRNINIRSFKQVTPLGDWADILITSRGGPLMIAGEVDNQQVAVLTFALQDSDLPLNLAFPILMANLMQWYTPPRVLDLTDSIAPGSPVTLRPIEGDSLRIIHPDGRETDHDLESAQVVFGDTREPGIYHIEVREGDDVINRDAFAVNLFDPAESAIAPQESIMLGSAIISESAREEIGQRELWQYLALLGLGILVVEWLYYHRRNWWKSAAPVYTPSRGKVR